MEDVKNNDVPKEAPKETPKEVQKEAPKVQQVKKTPKVKTKMNTWAIISIVLAIALIIMVFNPFGDEQTTTITTNTNIMPKAEISSYMETQLNNLLSGQATTIVNSVSEDNGMYVVNMTLSSSSQGDEVMTAYVTKDAKYMFVQPLDLSEIPDPAEELQKTLDSIPKTEKAKAELFIMTYCPYGLQSQKAMLPVLSLLGDKADIEIKFVDYAMHDAKEVYENLRQYCIQKEQNDKYVDYATCLVQSDKYEECLVNASVDTTMLATCMNTTDIEYNITTLLNNQTLWNSIYPPFNVQKADNEAYGVQGSPTLVINGKTINVDRSPELIKQAICAGFTTQPEECQTELSENTAAPSIGPLDEEYNSNIQASCS